MLRILNMGIPYKYKPHLSAERLFEDNGCFIFDIEAPAFWWVEFSGERVNLSILNADINSPLSSIIRGSVYLHYQEIVELCEDYIAGEYTRKATAWFAEREWIDFCETLLDIKGIRDLVQEEK